MRLLRLLYRTQYNIEDALFGMESAYNSLVRAETAIKKPQATDNTITHQEMDAAVCRALDKGKVT